MGINVRVESERAEVQAEVLDPQNLTAKLVAASKPTSCCLRFINPYGDTIFNILQLPVLVQELERVLASVSDPQLQAHARAVLDLANQAKGEAHTYLRFVGD